MTTTSIAARLAAQKERIRAAALASNRDPDEVTLIAVSKKQPVSAIVEAYAAGQRDFGENYVQELVEKAEQLTHCPDIRWHMIGHLQSNKARFVSQVAHRVHTVSSIKLANELGKRVAQRRRTVAESPEAHRLRAEGKLDTLPPTSLLPMCVLIEVNVSGEESKSGCKPEEVRDILAAVGEQPLLHATGLMTMPPANEDPEQARPHFERLVALRDELGGPPRLPELSMGMSHDADQAIAAGATFVRIGSAIFGPRTS